MHLTMPHFPMKHVKLRDIHAAEKNMKEMHRKYIAFLDNPAMVALFNEHVDTIIDEYSTITEQEYKDFARQEKVRFAIQKALVQPDNHTDLKSKHRDTPYVERLKQNTAMVQALRINPARIEEYKQIVTHLAITDLDHVAYIQGSQTSISYHMLELSPELQQAVYGHEMKHAMDDFNQTYPEQGTPPEIAQVLLELEQRKCVHFNHASELAADTLGTFLSPEKHASELEQLLEHTNKKVCVDIFVQRILKQDPTADIETTKQKALDNFIPTDPDEACDTHPSSNKRIENTRIVLEKLAAFHNNTAMSNKPAVSASAPQNKLTA